MNRNAQRFSLTVLSAAALTAGLVAAVDPPPPPPPPSVDAEASTPDRPALEKRLHEQVQSHASTDDVAERRALESDIRDTLDGLLVVDALALTDEQIEAMSELEVRKMLATLSDIRARGSQGELAQPLTERWRTLMSRYQTLHGGSQVGELTEHPDFIMLDALTDDDIAEFDARASRDVLTRIARLRQGAAMDAPGQDRLDELWSKVLSRLRDIRDGV